MGDGGFSGEFGGSGGVISANKKLGFLVPLAESKSQRREFASRYSEILNKILPPTEENIASIEARAKALAALQEAEAVRSEGDFIICNLDKLRNGFGLKNILGKTGSIKKTSALETMQEIFKDLKIISEDEYKTLTSLQPGSSKVEIKPKSLFYIPKNAETALDLEEIKKSEFYLGLWELKEANLKENYPLADYSKGQLKSWEAVTSALIYHPKYGAGERDEYGRLMVNYPGSIRDQINYRFFGEYRYYGAPKSENENLLASSPADFFIQRCANMVDRGLIEPFEDFYVTGGYSSAEKYGINAREIKDNGQIMIDQVRYYVGKLPHLFNKYGEGRYLAYKLSDKYAAIVRKDKNGTTQLIQGFKLYSKQEDFTPKTYGGSPGHNYIILKKGDFETYDPEQLKSLTDDNSAIFNNFQEFLQFSNTVQKEGINLSSLTIKEQNYMTNLLLIYKDNPRFWNFIKNFKLDGIRSMMTSKGDIENVELLWEIGEKTDVAKYMFKDIASIQKIINLAGQLHNEDINIEAIQLLNTAVTDQIKKIIQASIPLIKSGIKHYDFTDITSLMHSLKKRVQWHYSHFGGGESDVFSQTVELLKHPDINVQNLVLAFVQRDLAYGINMVDNKARELYSTGVLSAGQEKSYDESLDLRNWEAKTADTYHGLKHILKVIQSQNIPVRNILDEGTGQGRIGAKLARLGYKVFGLDISSDQLKMGRERIKEEGAGEALLKLKEEGLLGNTPLLDDEATSQNYIQIKGNFFNTREALKANNINEKFDTVIITWHTYAEFGTPEKQKEVLSQIFELMNSGGKLIIEMPDRKSPKYDTALKKYHRNNPHVPYGTIRDAKDTGEYPPRYFSSEDELVVWMKAPGFKIDPRTDIYKYTVGQNDEVFTENVFVATKP